MKTIRKLLQKPTRRTNTTRRLGLEHLDQRVVLSAAPLAGALPADPAPIANPGRLIVAAGEFSFAYGTLKYGVDSQPGNVPTQLGNLTGPGPGTVFGPQVRGGNNDRAANDGPMPQSLTHDVSVISDVVVSGTPAAFSSDSNMGFKLVRTDPPKNEAMQHNATDLVIAEMTAIPVLSADGVVPASSMPISSRDYSNSADAVFASHAQGADLVSELVK